MPNSVAYWLLSGLVFALIGIYIYRRDGNSFEAGEMYFVLLAVAVGPVTGIMLLMKAFRKYCDD